MYMKYENLIWSERKGTDISALRSYDEKYPVEPFVKIRSDPSK